jgi:hypothetical protein
MGKSKQEIIGERELKKENFFNSIIQIIKGGIYSRFRPFPSD